MLPSVTSTWSTGMKTCAVSASLRRSLAKAFPSLIVTTVSVLRDDSSVHPPIANDPAIASKASAYRIPLIMSISLVLRDPHRVGRQEQIIPEGEEQGTCHGSCARGPGAKCSVHRQLRRKIGRAEHKRKRAPCVLHARPPDCNEPSSTSWPSAS